MGFACYVKHILAEISVPPPVTEALTKPPTATYTQGLARLPMDIPRWSCQGIFQIFAREIKMVLDHDQGILSSHRFRLPDKPRPVFGNPMNYETAPHYKTE